jgi:hypothetical protein
VCYSVFLSTSSPEDLAPRSNDLARFEKAGLADPVTSVLLHEHKWFVGSSSGCSCTFRHLMNSELGFHEPVDWFPESDDALKATARFMEVVREILSSGHPVDCVDAWSGAEPGDIRGKHVDLSAVSSEQFRFFENYHFVFAKRRRRKRVVA